jgi:hypothetical protein
LPRTAIESNAEAEPEVMAEPAEGAKSTNSGWAIVNAGAVQPPPPRSTGFYSFQDHS